MFKGKTKDDEEITLYQDPNTPEEMHILRPNGEMWVLSPGTEMQTWVNPIKQEMRVDIKSPEWTGQATGSRWDLLSVEAR